MKRIAWIIGLLALLPALWIGAGPYLAVADIERGINDKDSERLAERMDFPTLRQNLKDQLKVTLLKSAAKELEDNPFGALATGLATTLVDGLVDAFITPAGLASLMDGERPSVGSLPSSSTPSSPTRKPDQEQTQDRDLFKNARHSYDSLSRFSVWVPGQDGRETRFVLQRDGLSWKLVNVILPLDEAT
ncbi:DUF2939 domain-containing protein [Allochromatium vinosum]|uniref:DUF2939 domain-containing protein n=1 Tax=Allochromatium vinosum (strain ATCC 17899 / DSM 180 / NBRC 103801 / NCIMB 10441 / D) TaxID=572477 RepID=D3RW55_ALLVD|nr:DUF2939 domain-containing protein [Allochromatium vinosum]ADC64067.1 conserved hypothetical protein [Allochromatium vinosum DSM 180]